MAAAHHREPGQFHIDPLGHDDVDAAHDGKGVDHHFGAGDLGLPEVEDAAAHDGDGGGAVADPPPALGGGAAHDGHDPPTDLAAGGFRLGLGSGREVGNQRVELAPGTSGEGAADPLGELVERQPPDDHVLAQQRHRLIAVSVRRPLEGLPARVGPGFRVVGGFHPVGHGCQFAASGSG
ncbi:MAG TPA: hypothetical protein VG205_11710 [Acidimicrobiales bacterium]|nr:hypothetical protein [Acidimicrobiales bacterium]